MADAITLEQRGLPAVVIAVDKLANTTGRSMAWAQGIPDYPIAIIPTEFASMDTVASDEQLDSMAKSVIDQVEAILTSQ